MITTPQEFYQQYMMKDGDLLCEEFLNKPFYRMKYEIQALISFFKLDNVLDWDPSTSYQKNDIVFHNDYFWICNNSSTGSEPDLNNSDWSFGSIGQIYSGSGNNQLLVIDKEEHTIDETTDNVTFENFPKLIFLNGVMLDSSEYSIDNNTKTVTFSRDLKVDDVVSGLILNYIDSSGTTYNTTSGTKKYEHTYSTSENNKITAPSDMDLSSVIIYNNGVVLRSTVYSINNSTKEITFTPDTLSNGDWILIQVV